MVTSALPEDPKKTRYPHMVPLVPGKGLDIWEGVMGSGPNIRGESDESLIGGCVQLVVSCMWESE